MVVFRDRQIFVRNIFKAQKDFEAADIIRAELKQAGIILEDTSEGTTWKVENS